MKPAHVQSVGSWHKHNAQYILINHAISIFMTRYFMNMCFGKSHKNCQEHNHVIIQLKKKKKKKDDILFCL